jgi:predicted DNA-binding transcriptional regulator AlpA
VNADSKAIAVAIAEITEEAWVGIDYRQDGIAEVAEMLKLSKQRTDQLARQVGFPAPVVTLAGGRVWDKSEIQAWMREVGR